jgi:hypothetical protein
MKIFDMINRTPKQHLLGKEYFRLPDLESLEGDRYFDCIDFLRPLFEKPDFLESAPGFYLNWITNLTQDGDDNKNSVRLTYFTINPSKTTEVIKNFENENSDKIKIYDSKTKERPIGKDLIDFDEKQNRFWQFLNDYTKISLDLLENYGRESSRKLVWEFRTCHLLERKLPKPFLEPVFSQNSEYFRKLKEFSLNEQFWKDLVYNFGPGNGFGLHFLVNMMGFIDPPYYFKIFEENWFLQ